MREEHLSIPATFHSLYSIMVPSLFLIIFSQILDLLFNGLLGVNSFTYLFIVLAALEEALVGYILYKERVDEIHRLREVFLLIFVMVGGRLLFTSGTWENRLASVITIPFLYLCLAVALQWFIAFLIRLNLRQREILLTSIHHKAGSELTQFIRKNVVLLDAVQTGIMSARIKLITFQLLCTAGLGVLYLTRKTLAPLFIGLNVFHMLICCIFIILFNRMLNELSLFTEGVRPGAYYKRKHLYYILFTLIAVITLAFLAAKDSSLFSLSMFEPLLDWFRGLLKIERLTARPQQPPRLPDQNYFDFINYLQQAVPPIKDNFLLQILAWGITILTYTILIVLALAFIYFLFSPFFSRYFRWHIKWWVPFQLFWKHFRRLLRGLRQIWQDFIYWLNRKNEYTTEKTGKERAQEIFELREARRLKITKRLQIRNFIKAFLKLAYWGTSKKQVTYYKYQGPMEYGLQLITVAPEQAEPIRTALEIFEEGLFSHHLVEKPKVKLYYKLVRQIISS